MQISNSVLNIILNASLIKYGGDLALSAIGIVTSIQTLILMPITGLMQGQQPLISYNYGALKMNRVKETFKICNYRCYNDCSDWFYRSTIFTKVLSICLMMKQML